MRAGRAAWSIGNAQKTDEHDTVAIELYDALGDAEQAGTATAALGDWLLESSRIDEGMALVRSRLARLPATGSPASVWLNNHLARGHLFRGEGRPALDAVNDALHTAESLRIREVTLQLLITKAWAVWVEGGYRESLALLTGAMKLADVEEDLLARTRARFNLSSQLVVEDPHRGLALAKEGIAILEQYGLPSASMAGNAAHMALLIGDLQEVLDVEAAATALRTSLGSMVHGAAGAALSFMGRPEEARARLAQVAELVEGSTSAQDVSALRYTEALTALGEGSLAETRRLALESRDAYHGGDTPISAVLASHAAALLGDLDGLREDFDWYHRNPITAAWLQRSGRVFEAAVLALEGSFADASSAYRRLIEEWRGADLRLDLALTLLERSRLMGHVDEEAADGRNEAQLLFEAMGADGLISRIEANSGALLEVASATQSASVQSEGVAVAER